MVHATLSKVIALIDSILIYSMEKEKLRGESIE